MTARWIPASLSCWSLRELEYEYTTPNSAQFMKRILVIDDDENSAEVAAGHLNGAGYEVVIASDGFAGLKLILTQRPNLILTDIWMPIGTGLSLAQRLHELGMGDVPIIFMTAGRQDGLRDSAIELGGFDFFEKPYESKELLKAVARALVAESQQSRVKRPPRSRWRREARGTISNVPQCDPTPVEVWMNCRE
jgi:CheY-like chemotaxis protein